MGIFTVKKVNYYTVTASSKKDAILKQEAEVDSVFTHTEVKARRQKKAKVQTETTTSSGAN